MKPISLAAVAALLIGTTPAAAVDLFANSAAVFTVDITGTGIFTSASQSLSIFWPGELPADPFAAVHFFDSAGAGVPLTVTLALTMVNDPDAGLHGHAVATLTRADTGASWGTLGIGTAEPGDGGIVITNPLLADGSPITMTAEGGGFGAAFSYVVPAAGDGAGYIVSSAAAGFWAPLTASRTIDGIASDYIYRNGSFEAVPPAAATVPEPAAWALMIAGFGLVGLAARRRGLPA